MQIGQIYWCRNVNYAWRIFQEIFMSILNDIAPLTKEIKIKQKTEPWITSEILDQIRERGSFLYLYKKTQSKHFYYDISTPIYLTNLHFLIYQ
jgi:hypothetical protein